MYLNRKGRRPPNILVTVPASYVAERNCSFWLRTPQHLPLYECRTNLPRDISKHENDYKIFTPWQYVPTAYVSRTLWHVSDAQVLPLCYTLEQVHLPRQRRLPWMCAIIYPEGYHTPSGSHQSHGLYGTSFWSISLEIQSICALSSLNLSLSLMESDLMIR